jgi:hypothetical protein
MERAINKERINKEKIKITSTLTLTLSPTERSPRISKKGPAGSLVKKKGQMSHFAILVGFLVGRTVCLAGNPLGRGCEVDRDCNGHGRCVDLDECKACICDQGYTGDFCATDVKRDLVGSVHTES